MAVIANAELMMPAFNVVVNFMTPMLRAKGRDGLGAGEHSRVNR